jgi:hypothetical protein
MPDVPPPDFVGAMCEIWFTVNYAAYHLAYTRVYLQTLTLHLVQKIGPVKQEVMSLLSG